MTITIILCALLCALTLLYMLKPMSGEKRFYIMAFACAVPALITYLALGAPGLTAAAKHQDTEARQMIQQEFEFMDRLSKNPDDADILIRLAALRVSQGRTNEETIRMLDRAETLHPNDPRIKIIRTIVKYPDLKL